MAEFVSESHHVPPASQKIQEDVGMQIGRHERTKRPSSFSVTGLSVNPAVVKKFLSNFRHLRRKFSERLKNDVFRLFKADLLFRRGYRSVAVIVMEFFVSQDFSFQGVIVGNKAAVSVANSDDRFNDLF